MQKLYAPHHLIEHRELLNSIERIEGWLSDREAFFLFTAGKKCLNNGVIVEIGSWKGKSTICLGKGSEAGHKIPVYAIDPHTGSPEHKEMYGSVWSYPQFIDNIRKSGLETMVHPIIHTSEEAAQTFAHNIEFIFIDGDHSYESIRRDFDLWYPKLAIGGIMAIHDTIGFEGPNLVARESMYRSQLFRHIGWVDSITFGEKVDKNSIVDRIRNRIVLLSREMIILYWSIPFPTFLKKLGNIIIYQLLWRDLY